VSDSLATAAIRPDYPEPLWIQTVELITSEIANGTLRQGQRLPPERELCQQLGISRVTLRKALTHLVDQGVLSPSHGRGWYVSDGSVTPSPARDWPNSLESFSETAARMGLPATSIVLRAAATPASLDEGELLQVPPGAPLFVLERVRLLGGMPIAVDRDKVPAALIPGHADIDFSTASLYESLTAAGIQLVRADSTVEATSADDELAGHLGIDPGKPVLVLTQLVVDADDRPVLASVIQYSGERYRLRTQFARSGGRRIR
jgi:DNA-binding GntR family transcriptional regulator